MGSYVPAHNPLSWICFALVAVVDFTSLPSTSHSLTELTHFVRVTRPCHCLQIDLNIQNLYFFVTPFSIARPSSLRKEGKSAVLDYWQFKVLHSALICFTNPASPNFFTGRAGFVLRTHTAHLPKSASWIIGVHKV